MVGVDLPPSGSRGAHEPHRRPAGSAAHAATWEFFETADPAEACEFLGLAYSASMRVGAVGDEQFVRHIRRDFGPFCVNDVFMGMEARYEVSPIGSLVIVQPRMGWAEHRWADTVERVSPGDIAVVAPPHLPFTTHVRDLDTGSVQLSQRLLMRSAGFAEHQPESALRFTATQPSSAGLADQWADSVTRVRSALAASAAAVNEPLAVGNIARGLAESALLAFPHTGAPVPTPADSHDATADAVTRAVAFIEENAHIDIGLVDIAAAIRVTPHALRIAFARHHPTSAVGCLRGVRLGRAHFDLLDAVSPVPADGPSAVAVRQEATDAALLAGVGARWGFTSHADFSASYHHRYGVSPEDTLAV